MKFKITLEYAGTNYSGWQKQKNAKTVQDTIINAVKTAFSKCNGKNIFTDLQGSGRTDKGVHALGQVAHLECDTMIAPHILQFKINDELPSDINILDIVKAPQNFHARHSAVSRQYLYRISERRTAFEKKFVWWIKDSLNIEKMSVASALFKGMHDFSSFTEESPDQQSTKVLIEDINISRNESSKYIILIRIRASHFLWKMVRRIAGVLAETGRGNFTDKDILYFMKNYSDAPAKYTAPPSGLFLEKVYY
jgi:tRNA pseudouridine38-40 synthase